MAKLFVIIIISVSIAANFVTSFQTDSGYEFGLIAGNGLFKGYESHGVLVSKLVSILSGPATDLICSLIGPNFLQVIVSSNKCLSGVKLPNAFHSYKDFCAFYNRACPDVKKCLTNAAIQIKIDVPKIFRGNLIIAKCCKHCESNSQTHNELSGALGKSLFSVQLLSSNLVTSLVSNIGGVGNALVCSFIGPEFFRIILVNNNCPSGVVFPTIFHSTEHFCAFYTGAAPPVKKCLTDAAIQIKDKLHIDGGEINVGKCCAYCASKNIGSNTDNLPHCTPIVKTENNGC